MGVGYGQAMDAAIYSAMDAIGDDDCVGYQVEVALMYASSKEDSCIVYYEIGNHYRKRTDNAAFASWYLEEAIGLGLEDMRSAKANLSKALLYYGEGDYPASEGYYERAAQLFEQQEGSGIFIAICYLNLGRIYARYGDYERAIEYYGAAARQSDLGFIQAKTQVNTLIESGTAYSYLGEYEKAVSYYNEVLGVEGLRLEDRGIVYNNMADTYLMEGKFVLALSHSLDAIGAFQRMYSEAIEGLKEGGNPADTLFAELRLAEAHKTLGRVYLAEDSLRNALLHYEQAWRLMQRNYENTGRREVAKIALELGNAKRLEGDYEGAIGHFVEALKCVVPLEEKEGVWDAPKESYYAENVIVEGWRGLAFTYHDWAKDVKVGKVEESSLGVKALYGRSMQYYDKALDMADFLRLGFRYESSKYVVGATYQKMNERVIELAHSLYEETGEEQWLERAFTFSEKSKALVLLESIKEFAARNSVGIPDSLLEEEKRLRQEMDFYEERVLEASRLGEEDSVKLEGWRQKMFGLRESYTRLLERLESEFPAYHQLKYNLSLSSVADVKAYLPKKSGLVSYFLGEEKGYVFLVTREGVKVETLAIDSVLFGEIRSARAYLEEVGEDKGAFEETAKRLYDRLLKPVLADVSLNRLVIVPDRELGYLPFEVLIQSDSKEGGMPDYLLGDYDVSYGYSASMLIQKPLRARVGGLTSYGGFAIPVSGGDNVGLVEKLAGRFGGSFDPLAKKDAFLADADQFEMLHLAVHGQDSLENPLYARVIFSDDTLFAYEIYNRLHLNADLTVLSVCETGSGAVQVGEGVMSLARAFRYAGCPNVVMSHWEATSGHANTIIDGFFGYLWQGYAKDAALRKAKLDFLATASPGDRHPYVWSTLVLIGDYERMYWGWMRVLLWGLGAVVLVGGGIYVARRARKGS